MSLDEGKLLQNPLPERVTTMSALQAIAEKANTEGLCFLDGSGQACFAVVRVDDDEGRTSLDVSTRALDVNAAKHPGVEE